MGVVVSGWMWEWEWEHILLLPWLVQLYSACVLDRSLFGRVLLFAPNRLCYALWTVVKISQLTLYSFPPNNYSASRLRKKQAKDRNAAILRDSVRCVGAECPSLVVLRDQVHIKSIIWRQHATCIPSILHWHPLVLVFSLSPYYASTKACARFAIN